MTLPQKVEKNSSFFPDYFPFALKNVKDQSFPAIDNGA
jgi:hypothetical protein